MDNNYVIITIGNTDFYLEASRYYDLAYIDNKLVNISNQSITMVNSFDANYTTYPRITCSAMQQCILRSSSSANYQAITQDIRLKDSKFNMNMLNNSNQNNLLIALLTIILGVKLLWKR